MKHVIRVIVHGAWLVPLLLGRPYFAVALLLFALLCYVKVFKFRQQLAELQQRGGEPGRETIVKNALKRWQALTWLRDA